MTPSSSPKAILLRRRVAPQVAPQNRCSRKCCHRRKGQSSVKVSLGRSSTLLIMIVADRLAGGLAAGSASAAEPTATHCKTDLAHSFGRVAGGQEKWSASRNSTSTRPSNMRQPNSQQGGYR
eukprot:CAMPEP_0119062032 /NCGR_PEP_ID=MMETSP1178-20130426/5711_1 /TAXON_ID=33656 /ORGANISM="unid sp, Strain CCMP2000" /LENGTH=121 /DNA_ID=CAMNT_0007043273 /DNA_START=164 /DNA_END=530 /DNA_ORIENTATION=+